MAESQSVGLYPLYPNSFESKKLVSKKPIAIEKCRCEFNPPCIHKLASTGNIDELKKFIDYEGLSAEEMKYKDRILRSITANNHLTVLHCAARFQGSPSTGFAMVDKILSVASTRLSAEDMFQFVNAKDVNNITALYMAAKMKNLQSCKRVLYAGGDMDIPTNRCKTPGIKIFRKIPELMRDVILEYPCATYSDLEFTTVTLDFGCIMGIPSLEDQGCPSLYEEMDLIANIGHTAIDDRHLILEIPLVKTLIWLKWQRAKLNFWVARFFQIIWFLTYFVYLMTVYRQNCPYPSEKIYNFTWMSFSPQTETNHDNTSDIHLPLSQRNCDGGGVGGWIVITAAIVDGIVFEGYPMWVRFRRKWYPMKSISAPKLFKRCVLFIDMLHPQKLIFLSSIFVNTLPIQLGIDVFSLELQYTFVSIGVFLCWFQIFLQIGKVPQLKGYTKMLRQVLYRLCMVGLLYASLIVAFAMTFCILLPSVGSFASPIEALFRMSTFLIGEVDFEGRFYTDPESLPASFLVTMAFYGAAILFLHIALLNFLIGLTSTDIREIASQSKVWETHTYLWQIYLLETFLSRFPFGWGRAYLKSLMLIPQDYKAVKDLDQVKFEYTIPLERLPKTLRKGLREVHLLKLANSRRIRRFSSSVSVKQY